MIKNRFFSTFNRILNKIKFWNFQRQINIKSCLNHDSILDWANSLGEIKYKGDSKGEVLVELGDSLRFALLRDFENKFSNLKEIKILIHLPPKNISPGGYSAFSNLIQSLQYLGISCKSLEWGDDIGMILNDFKPSIFLSSDNREYLERIDWKEIRRYKNNDNRLMIGLSASIEAYGNTPLPKRLDKAKEFGVTFYYSFKSQEYLHLRDDYKPFFERGYKIFSIEFGANPLIHYPIPGIQKDLPYVFLASSNSEKQERYKNWLKPVLANSYGFLDGPGWKHHSRYADKSVHKYLYARGRVGINLHIQDSIDWPSELNERTYILAACGVPQLIDNPKLLFQRFSAGAVFCSETPKNYEKLFRYILNTPDEAHQKALIAIREVYSKHTTFHRAEKFLMELNEEAKTQKI